MKQFSVEYFYHVAIKNKFKPKFIIRDIGLTNPINHLSDKQNIIVCNSNTIILNGSKAVPIWQIFD